MRLYYKISALLFVLAITGCSKPDNPTPVPRDSVLVTTPVLSTDKDPSITGFSMNFPILTIKGKNFDSAATNIVKFDTTVIPVISTSTTSLTVRMPSKSTSKSINISVTTKATRYATVSYYFDFAEYTTVSTLAGNGYAAGATKDGTGKDAQFDFPYAITTDRNDNIFVSQLALKNTASSIRMVTPGGVVTTIAPTAPYGYVDGAVADARFNVISGLAVDASGNIYISDTRNHCIRRLSTSGIVTTIAGNGTAGYADGTGSAARFNTPYSIALDADGNILVADGKNNRIRKVTPAGVVTTVAGSTKGSVDGTGTAAQFDLPEGLTIDAGGNIYVAEGAGEIKMIRKIAPSGAVTKIAGISFGINYATNLYGSMLNIVIDKNGEIYIADIQYNIIYRIDSALHVMESVAGHNLESFSGYWDGPGSSAYFSGPVSFTVDSKGNLFVTDAGNSVIRKIIIPVW